MGSWLHDFWDRSNGGTSAAAPVKNTFIQFPADQPSAFERKTVSERHPPGAVAYGDSEDDEDAGFAEANRMRAEPAFILEAPPQSPTTRSTAAPLLEPAFVPLPAAGSALGGAAAARRGGPAKTLEASDDSPDEAVPDSTICSPTGALVTVKNTFIHYVDDEQPSIFTKKSVSGPAYFARVGEEFAMAANLGRPSVAKETAATEDAPCLGSEQRPAPSVGSAGHGSGNCRPCAHNWRPGGCSKGQSCTFCHLCEDGVLKQRKKEKLSRIRAERRQKARAAGQDDREGDSEDCEEEQPGPSAASGGYQSNLEGRGEAATAAAPAAALLGEPPSLAAPASSAPQSDEENTSRAGSKASAGSVGPAVGEVAISYDGASLDFAEVCLRVNLQQLRQRHRCGLSRRFTLQLRECEVPFLLALTPDIGNASAGAAGSAEVASFRKADAPAVIQVKCTDAAALPSDASGCKCKFGVAFAAGGLAPRQASSKHDFESEPLCSLPKRDAFWDLVAAAGGRSATTCVVKVLFSPSP